MAAASSLSRSQLDTFGSALRLFGVGAQSRKAQLSLLTAAAGPLPPSPTLLLFRTAALLSATSEELATALTCCSALVLQLQHAKCSTAGCAV
jgi:hypothetical protein